MQTNRKMPFKLAAETIMNNYINEMTEEQKELYIEFTQKETKSPNDLKKDYNIK